VCQLINRLLSSLGDDAAIDDELYEKIYTSLQCRLRDKFPVVRVHAVLALARLQDPSDPECPIIAGMYQNSSHNMKVLLKLILMYRTCISYIIEVEWVVWFIWCVRHY